MLGVGVFLFWATHHAEVSFADGLRSVRQAQRIERGDLAGGLWRSIDHPLHPLAIAALHQTLGVGDGPYGWQTAAQVASALALVLAVAPLYLLARDLFDDDTSAALAVLLVMAGPVVTDVAVNVSSETTFLLFWAWGLWAAVRFLRAGSFGWLIPTVAFGALAYLTRPEGLLLHLALVAALLLLPLLRGTHILWRRWWAAVGVLVLGPALLVGPYVAAKGGLGTRPAVGRLIGTMPEAPPEALEREGPLTPGQTVGQTYAIATGRVVKAVRGAVPLPLWPLAVLGLVVARRGAGRGQARAWLLLGVLGLGACAGLVRLHATGGYCTVRHALIPATILTLAAAHGLAWVMHAVSFDGRRLGLGEGRLTPGPAVWALAIAAVVAWPLDRARTPYRSSFAAYRQAGTWLADLPEADGQVLDMTDWSLFFSGRDGAGFARVLEAADRPATRFLVVRDAHLTGHLHYNEVLRRLVAGRAPLARFPDRPTARQWQVAVYDLAGPSRDGMAEAPANTDPETRHR
jgi:hypothetical protein